ncbi:MAG: hypothetical protein MUC54_05385, partial [Chloroflexi bacterium]|nr:hypothetical protein [Chloroflexota bacterium]
SLLQVPVAWEIEDVGWEPLETGEALLLAAACALGAAVVGGGAGGRLVRTRPTEATLVAIGTSWPVGIILLPAVAAAFGIRLRTAIFCFDVCTVSLTDANPLSGIGAYVLALLMGVLLVVPPIVALVLLLAALRTAPARGKMLGSVLVVAAYAVLHLWTLPDGGIPFVCLAIGAVAWTALLRGPGTAPGPAPTALTGRRKAMFWGIVAFLVLVIAWFVLQQSV